MNVAPPPTGLRPVTPHTILSAKMAELYARLEATGPDAELLALAAECRELIEPLDAYLAEHSSSPSPELDDLERRTNELDWDAAYERGATSIRLEKEMVSGAVEGQLLQLLVSLTDARRILEIGSFTGYASLAMAEALPDDGTLVACEYDPFAAAFAREQLGQTAAGQKVDILVGDARVSLRRLYAAGDTFDLIFLDADKQGYAEYYRAILDENLLRPGGLLCVDNTLYMGQAYGAPPDTENGAAVRAFNRLVLADPRVRQVILPLRDGITLIQRTT